jgi:MFS family permease
MSLDDTDDPTLVRNQPSLTTSTGRTWLIVGALFTAISLAVLLPMTALAPPGVALTAATLDVVFYAGMLAARFAVPSGRRRLALMAVALLAIAVASFAAALIVAFAQV